jgi:hypothetical protein
MGMTQSYERVSPAAVALDLGVSAEEVMDWLDDGLLIRRLLQALRARNREISRLRAFAPAAALHDRGLPSHNDA